MQRTKQLKFTVENLNPNGKKPYLQIEDENMKRVPLPRGLFQAFCGHASKNPKTGKLFFPLGKDILSKLPEGKKKDMKISYLGYFNENKVALLLCERNTAYIFYPPPEMLVPCKWEPLTFRKKKNNENSVPFREAENPFAPLHREEEKNKVKKLEHFPPLSGGKKTSSYNPKWGQNARKRI